MRTRLSIVLIVLGAILAIAGGELALQFYAFNVGIFKVTIWREVIIFSTIAITGEIMLASGVRLWRRETLLTS